MTDHAMLIERSLDGLIWVDGADATNALMAEAATALAALTAERDRYREALERVSHSESLLIAALFVLVLTLGSETGRAIVLGAVA